MSGKRGVRLTQDDRAKILAMLKEGKATADISKAIGVSVPTIYKIRKEAGLAKGRGETGPKLGYEQIRAKYEAAVKEAELWKTRLAEALAAELKKLEKDRQELGL